MRCSQPWVQQRSAPSRLPRSLSLASRSLSIAIPVALSPCVSATVTPVTSAGVPAPIVLPSADKLRESFSLAGASGQVAPFYASAGGGPDAAQHTNVVLLLVDISGSMNQPMAGSTSRFEAAKTAIGQFLDSMQEGSDRVAIVPFESHNVSSTIRGAVFATRRLTQWHS